MDNIFPWRAQTSLKEILAAARPVFLELELIDPNRGCTEVEIADAERRIQSPLPPEVREFYKAMRPTTVFGPSFMKEFGFYPIGTTEFKWQSMKEAEPAEDWTTARGLALGQSAYGDPFWWVEGHRSLPNGSIVLLDHEGAIGNLMFVHFARNLGEFIAKIAYFKNLYPENQDPLFQRDYLELNPLVNM